MCYEREKKNGTIYTGRNKPSGKKKKEQKFKTNSLNSLIELWEAIGNVESKEAKPPIENTGLEKYVLQKGT